MKKNFLKFTAITSALAVGIIVGAFHPIILHFLPRIARQHYKWLLLRFGS